VFIPYLGKNDFQLWWDDFTEYEHEASYVPKKSYHIETIFVKKEGTTIRESTESNRGAIFDFSEPLTPDFFIYFENLPIEFDEQIKHYRLASFVFTNKMLKKDYMLNNLCLLKNKDKVVQLL
jgi:CRISPR-associated protein Cas5h